MRGLLTGRACSAVARTAKPERSGAGDDEQSVVLGGVESCNDVPVISEHAGDFCGGDVAEAEPDDLGWRAVEEGKLSEVRVLRDDDVVVFAGLPPDFLVGCGVEPDGGDVSAVGEVLAESANEVA